MAIASSVKKRGLRLSPALGDRVVESLSSTGFNYPDMASHIGERRPVDAMGELFSEVFAVAGVESDDEALLAAARVGPQRAAYHAGRRLNRHWAQHRGSASVRRRVIKQSDCP